MEEPIGFSIDKQLSSFCFLINFESIGKIDMGQQLHIESCFFYFWSLCFSMLLLLHFKPVLKRLDPEKKTTHSFIGENLMNSMTLAILRFSSVNNRHLFSGSVAPTWFNFSIFSRFKENLRIIYFILVLIFPINAL